MDLPPPQPVPAASPAAVIARTRRVNGLVAGVLLLSSGAVLGLSLWLRPDPAGVGTHEQLGLPPCGLYVRTGLPCATCGMTTAFACAARGRLGVAVVAQPAGAVLAVVNAMLLLVGAYALVFDAPLLPLGRWLWRSTTAWAFGLLVLGAWAYKLLVAYGKL